MNKLKKAKRVSETAIREDAVILEKAKIPYFKDGIWRHSGIKHEKVIVNGWNDEIDELELINL